MSDGTLVKIYSCNKGHYFQESYCVSFYSPLKKFHPPCLFKTTDDPIKHIINYSNSSENRYKCRTCNKYFTYKNDNNKQNIHNNSVMNMDTTDHITNNEKDDFEVTATENNFSNLNDLIHNISFLKVL